MIERVISGGQTGVDRAALDAALALGVGCGGWCPRGRRAEDGVIPAGYPLVETETRRYSQRTRLNIQDSDATLILNRGEVEGGTAFTLQLSQKMGKLWKLVQLDDPSEMEIEKVMTWLCANNVRVLNVAGPRESNRPGIHYQAILYLRSLLSLIRSHKCEVIY